MLRFYGTQPPERLDKLRPGGVCPHCNDGARFSRASVPLPRLLQDDELEEVVISYYCEICLGAIPIHWDIGGWSNDVPRVGNPRVVLPSKENFNFEHVPDNVTSEIEEALNCLSVNAYNGFAALCRRVVQTICTELGTEGSNKVQKQIKKMLEMTDLGQDWEDLAMQIMLAGHDGAHPHLPEVTPARAQVLLSLLRDLCYELFTRPGNIRDSATLRAEVIANN